MHPVIAKTFGGLSKPYYFRQFKMVPPVAMSQILHRFVTRR